MSADGERWFLINASPDVLRQIQENRQLWPKTLRDSPICGVVLTNGDLDHVLGLFQLRESQPLSLYATPRVHAGLRRNAALKTLQRFEGHLRTHDLVLGEKAQLCCADNAASGIFIEAFGVPGKPPLHLRGEAHFAGAATAQAPCPEDNVALRIGTATSGALVYASAVADVREAASAFGGCAALLLDGTFWSEEELPDLGVNMGPARSMAHHPVGGEAGSLRALADLDVPRRIFTHLNNTNPILDESSPQYAEVVASGWEVACDGLQFRIE